MGGSGNSYSWKHLRLVTRRLVMMISPTSSKIRRYLITVFWDLSRERESSEQFVWYVETETQLRR